MAAPARGGERGERGERRSMSAEEPWVGPHGRVMERLELHLTYHCPERCLFCSEDHRMQRFSAFPVTFARVATVLREQARRGIQAVHLTGGEPTIHPRFTDVLRLARKLGLRTSIGTIGTMLARPEFAAEAAPLLDEALFSLHGPDAETHDTMAGREGSFEQVCRAIRLSRDAAPRLRAFVNTVVTCGNLGRLPETVALARDLGAELIIVSNLTPEGAGEDRYDTLAADLSALAAILPSIPAKAEPAAVRFFGVPMCVLGSAALHSNDLHWDPRVTVEWTYHQGWVELSPIYSWSPDRRRVHVPACESCRHRPHCAGVFDTYAASRDLGALRPSPAMGGG